MHIRYRENGQRKNSLGTDYESFGSMQRKFATYEVLIESEPWRVSLGAVLAMQAKVALYRKDYPGVLKCY